MRKKDILIILSAVFLSVAMAISQLWEKSIQTGAWGLHFSGTGQPPSGPAGNGQLEKYDAAYLGDPEEKVLYLTFDAGYENGYTEQILDILEKHKVPAAFFLTGHYLQQNPQLVQRMVRQGHTVGNHTMHHYDMSKLTDPEVFQKELRELETLYEGITGEQMPLFYRPPQGVYSEENLAMAKAMGYKTVFWSLAYADWDNAKQPQPDAAMEKLTERTHNGAVILLHATSATNAKILDSLLTHWEHQGYRFADLAYLFDGC